MLWQPELPPGLKVRWDNPLPCPGNAVLAVPQDRLFLLSDVTYLQTQSLPSAALSAWSHRPPLGTAEAFPHPSARRGWQGKCPWPGRRPHTERCSVTELCGLQVSPVSQRNFLLSKFCPLCTSEASQSCHPKPWLRHWPCHCPGCPQ